jgi:hypothetical protein
VIAVGSLRSGSLEWGITFVPGRHVTDHQTRLFLQLRRNHATGIAAAKASICVIIVFVSLSAAVARLRAEH